MIKQIYPTKQGQIVKCLVSLPGLEPEEQFLLADDPQLFNEEDSVVVNSITEFLRCHAKGEHPFPNKVKLNCLTVISDSVQEWVESWNNE